MISTDAAAFFECVPVAYIHQMINLGNVNGNVKKKLVSRSSLRAHLDTRKKR